MCRGRAARRSRLATALRAGTASLYINRGRYVHAILCPRPCVAALAPGRAACGEAAAACRGRAARRCRVSALRLIDPRKLYSILRPGSINRLIVNNPTHYPTSNNQIFVDHSSIICEYHILWIFAHPISEGRNLKRKGNRNHKYHRNLTDLPCLRGRPAQLQHAEGSEPRQWSVNNEPTTFRSQVRQPTTRLPCHPIIDNST